MSFGAADLWPWCYKTARISGNKQEVTSALACKSEGSDEKVQLSG